MNIDLSFSFCRHNDVVLTSLANGQTGVFYTQKTPTSALLELQRQIQQADEADQTEVVFEKLSDLRPMVVSGMSFSRWMISANCSTVLAAWCRTPQRGYPRARRDVPGIMPLGFG